MTTDLHDLFSHAYRELPPSPLDADLVVRRGRRLRARRRAANGTGALLGAGVVVAGSMALVGVDGIGITGSTSPAGGGSPVLTTLDSGFAGAADGGGSGLVTPSPVPSWPEGSSPVVGQRVPAAPSPGPSSSGSTGQSVRLEPRPVGIDSVALPNPAPGFPLRRWPDSVFPWTSGAGQTAYYVATFGLARTPPATVAGSPGSQGPTGPEVTIVVGDFPAASGPLAGGPVVARPVVAGVTGAVTTGADKGAPTRDLVFTTGRWTVEMHALGDVTTDELVALGNALTGIR